MGNLVLWLPTIILGSLAVILVVGWARYTFASPVTLPTVTDQRVTLPARPLSAPAALPKPIASEMTVVEIVCLKILNGPSTGAEFMLKVGDVYIGRIQNSEENILIALDDPSVSRRHAKLQMNGQTGVVTIQDCDSTYGTHLIRGNDSILRLSPGSEVSLQNGDILQFGNQIKLQLTMPVSNSPANPSSLMTSL